MKGLYAYFGLLDLHSVDSPGHSFYQLGLIDSLSCEFGISQFDFFSYYPEEIQQGYGYPNSELGSVFQRYHKERIDGYLLAKDELIGRIEEKKYEALYLKARFRNLSTLAKKWKDARVFEEIIRAAVNAGYTKEKIIILDTDLSLPDNFSTNYGSYVTILVPSIDLPAISDRFLRDCVQANVSLKEYSKLKRSVFYGNIDTSNYKAGNAKSPMLATVLAYFETARPAGELTVISKSRDLAHLPTGTETIVRNNRAEIWKALEQNLIMINVTKEKYSEEGFIPARVFEALIFGMIPVSYGFEFLCPAFSFTNTDDLDEIIRYLTECNTEDLRAAYLHAVNHYFDYCKKAYL